VHTRTAQLLVKVDEALMREGRTRRRARRTTRVGEGSIVPRRCSYEARMAIGSEVEEIKRCVRSSRAELGEGKQRSLFLALLCWQNQLQVRSRASVLSLVFHSTHLAFSSNCSRDFPSSPHLLSSHNSLSSTTTLAASEPPQTLPHVPHRTRPSCPLSPCTRNSSKESPE
jgi:hypothetical protein